jgi:hypothetical protein
MLEQSHRSVLLSIDPSILEQGMQFLRLACCDSLLAPRYIVLLERLNNLATNDMETMSCNFQDDKGQTNTEQEFLPSVLVEGGLLPDFPPPSLDPLDPLFGFGLPPDLLMIDWG